MRECSSCGQRVGARAVETKMLGGRVTGLWHPRCFEQRRYELSGAPQSEPPKASVKGPKNKPNYRERNRTPA